MDPKKISEFRRAVRGYLADRPAVSQTVATIRRFLSHEVPCTEEDVASACTVLTALGQLHELPDGLGGPLRYYRITAQGILDHEAGR